MENYQLPSLSMIPLYRSEGGPTRTVMDWKEVGTIIERELIKDGFSVRVFPLEDELERVVFGIIISEDRFSLNYYKEMFERNIQNLAENDYWSLTEAPDGSRAFTLSLSKEQVVTLELRSALECKEISSSPSRLTIPIGKAFTDTVESIDVRFFSCLYLQDQMDYTPGLADIFMTGLMFRTTPRDLRFLLLDHAHLLDKYYDLPLLFEPPVQTESGCREVLKWLAGEIVDRLNAMELRGSKSLDGYNASLRVDERAFTRLLVVVSSAEGLESDADFAAVLRLVREHGLMVGIHFFLMVSEAVPVTYITKNTVTFKRAIDAESTTKLRIKKYQVRRGEHTPHFLECCYTEQSDIDTVVKYLKENNQLKYANLMNIAGIKAEPLEEKKPEENKQDEVLLFSFSEHSSSGEKDLEETQTDPVPAEEWRPQIYIPKIDENATVSKEPLDIRRHHVIQGYRTTIRHNPESSRKGNDGQPNEEALKTVPVSTEYVDIPTERTETAGNAAPAVENASVQTETVHPETSQVQSGAEIENAPKKQRPVRKAKVLPVVCGVLLLLGGTYVILSRSHFLPSIKDFLPKPSVSDISADPTAEPGTTPIPTVESTPAPTAVISNTEVPVATPIIQMSHSDSATVATTVPVTSMAPVTEKKSELIETGTAVSEPTSTPESIINDSHIFETMEPAAVSESTKVPTDSAKVTSKTTPKVQTIKATEAPTATPKLQIDMATTAPTDEPASKQVDAITEKLVMAVTTPKVQTISATAIPTDVPSVLPTEAVKKATAAPTATPKLQAYTATEAPVEAAVTPKLQAHTSTKAPVESAATPKPQAHVATEAPVEATATPAPEQVTPEPTTAVFVPTTAPVEATTAPKLQAHTSSDVSSETASDASATETSDDEKNMSAESKTEKTVLPSISATGKQDTEEDVASGTIQSIGFGKNMESENSLDEVDGNKRTPLKPVGFTTDETNDDTQAEETSQLQNAPVIEESDRTGNESRKQYFDSGKDHFSLGDVGPEVMMIKSRLADLGYYGGQVLLNERYNSFMENYVKGFQKANNLPETGEIGPEELALLFPDGVSAK